MKNESWLLTGSLFLRALLGFCAAAFLAIYLVPDEAQYYLWSQNLGLSYYSKPPGIAYQIAISTSLAGGSEFGIRFLSVVIAALIGFALYRVARNLRFTKKIALYAALLFCFSPIGLIGSFAATTDGGMLLFAVLAFGALSRSKGPDWLLFGFFMMLSALFKWTSLLLWLPAFLGLIIYPNWRKKSVFVALAISLLAFVPPLLWNKEKGWPSFLHVFHQMAPVKKSAPNPVSFILIQIALLFPIPFYYFIKALLRSLRRKKPQEIAFPSFTAALILAVFWLLSFFEKAQGNWALLFMPFAALSAAAVGKMRILKISLLLSTLLSVIMLFLPLLERHERTAIPYRFNLFKDAMGWDLLKTVLAELPPADFFFSNTYQMASLISYYGPGQKRAYLLNVDQRRHSHFSFMPSLKDEQKGKNGYFVRLEEKPFDRTSVINKIGGQLAPYFASVELVGIYPLFTVDGKAVKWIVVFKCYAYNGLEPSKAVSY